MIARTLVGDFGTALEVHPPRGVFPMSKSVLVTVAIAGMMAASTSLGADSSVPDLAALQAKDPTTSIQYLYELCTGADITKRNFCTGYIVGLAETLGEIGLQKSARSTGICWKGASVDYAAAVQVFKNWAEKHPEAWGLPRYAGVMWALKEIWPCST
jgi:Rap1a immunity proteins